MKLTVVKWLAAAVTLTIAAFVTLWLLQTFNAVRYDGEVIINIVGLGLLTIVLAGPGVVAMVIALLYVLMRRAIHAWVIAGLAGSGTAAIGATALAIAAGCVPHCEGAQGSLQAGLLFGIPAGFGVGSVVYATWRWLATRIITAMVIRRVA